MPDPSDPEIPSVPEVSPPPFSDGRDFDAMIAQVRALFVALTALMVAVNGVVVAVSGFRTGKQVQEVRDATDHNRVQIEAVGHKADAIHRQVKELDEVRPARPPGPGEAPVESEAQPGP